MIIRSQHKPKVSHRDGEWHWRFAYLPTRVSETELAWWDFYYARLVTDDEGCWAGGWRGHWERVKLGGGISELFKGPTIT